MVRTTVVLEDSLFKKIKAMALKKRSTFKDTIVEILNRGLNRSPRAAGAEKPVFKTFNGGKGAVPVHDRDALFAKMGEHP